MHVTPKNQSHILNINFAEPSIKDISSQLPEYSDSENSINTETQTSHFILLLERQVDTV
jgi:hypothetical protein